MWRSCLRSLCLVLVLLTSTLLVGCTKCSGDSDDVLALLQAKQGRVERDFAAKAEAFEPAPLNAAFRVGDAVRTDAGAQATLRLSDGSDLKLEPSTLIRFFEHPPGEPGQRLEIEMGEATLQIGDRPLALQTGVGRARIEAKSRIKLSATGRGVRFDLAIGAAQFETQRGPVKLTAGEQLELAKGGATVAAAPAGSTNVAQSPQAPAPTEVAKADGEVSAQIEGAGASVRAPGAKQFAPLAPGQQRLAQGSQLRLDAGTTAQLRRGAEAARLEGAGDFVVGGPDSLVRASSGAVSVAQSGSQVKIRVPGGSITVEANARAAVRTGRNETTVNVSGGSAALQTETKTQTLSAGEEASVDARGRITLTRGRGPSVIDLLMGSGDSLVLHDPRPPTAIGITVASKCPSGAVVALGSRAGARSFGEGTVKLLVPAGSHKYRVHCAVDGQEQEAVVDEGMLTVLRDSGTRQLARTAPMTRVDTDGRNYTVLYQTLMPKLSVRWPDAPKSGSYRLEVSSPGGKKLSLRSATAAHTFAPGSLLEGVHQLQFWTDGASKSKPTSLKIGFDNAAPTASLTSPAEGGFAAGSSVQVSGSALPGWSVSAGGVELPQDDQHRFSGSAATAPGQRGLLVRFAHPQRGVHSYLRRSAGGGS